MSAAMQSNQVLYTARAHTTGGRDGSSPRDDGRHDTKHSTPGTGSPDTNPEHLFAADWSACFEGAMGLAARQMKIPLPHDLSIDAEIDLCLADGRYFLQGRMNVSLPRVGRDVAQAVVEAARQTCLYSKAIDGNVNVQVNQV